MSKNQVFFHLGLPKVASTFCQKVIFPNLSDVKFFKKRRFCEYKTMSGTETGKFLFSSEGDRGLCDTVATILDKFAHAQFILCFRRHDDWLLSKYKYHIRKNGRLTFTEFFDIHQNRGEWKQEELFYQDIISQTETLTGRKPLVLTLSMLKKSPDAFIGQLTDFMDTRFTSYGKEQKKVKISLKDKQLVVIRAFNRLPLPDQITTKHKFLNTTHGVVRKFSIHIVAFFSHFIPNFLLKHMPLLTEQEKRDLLKIRQIYADDWKFVEEYSKSKESVSV